MAKKVTTKRREGDDQEPAEQNILQALGMVKDDVATIKDKDEPKDKGPTTEELLARIDAMGTRLEQAERANMALTTVVPVASATVDPKSEAIDLTTGMPDLITEPEAYQRELNLRIEKAFQARTSRQQQANQQANQQSQASDTLWADFIEAQPEMAEDPDRVEYVTIQVVRKAQARGLDVQRYMHGNRERFIADVAKEYERVFGKPGDDTKGDEPDNKGDEPDRSTSIFGGQEGGYQTPKIPKGGSDMIKDIKDMQRASGFW